MGEHHDWIAETIAEIDRVLEAPPITIEDSINEAISKGRMTLQEGIDCLEAYQRAFMRGKEEFLE